MFIFCRNNDNKFKIDIIKTFNVDVERYSINKHGELKKIKIKHKVPFITYKVTEFNNNMDIVDSIVMSVPLYKNIKEHKRKLINSYKNIIL